MRHRLRGRKLGRNASHRKAMFRNMACSLIRSVRVDEDDPARPKVPGRIVTTLPKAKELRPYVERLVTIARKAARIEQQAKQYATEADRNSDEWNAWRTSDGWQKWNQAVAPAVALRRRAFATLRDNEAVDVLFTELAERFADRPGGYTRVVRLSEVRLGDAGRTALIEFVGERDRAKHAKRQAPAVVDDEETSTETPTASDEDASQEAANEDETAAGDPPAEETTDADDDAKS
ncbi:MAG: bL17 family ribosomal protein [Planctomycetaceae bacterium]